MIITVMLNSAIDVVVSKKDYEQYQKDGSKGYPVAAGKGLNVSRALYSLGCESLCIALVGKEDVSFFTNAQNELVNLKLIPVAGKTRRNITISDTDDGKEKHYITMGYKADGTYLDLVIEALKKNVSPGDYVICTGSLPEDMPLDAYNRLLLLCNELGAYGIVDAGSNVLKCALSGKPFMIMPNEEEFLALGMSGTLEEQIKKIAETNSIDYVIVTLDAKGAIMYDHCSEQMTTVNAFSGNRPIVTSVGSGDSAMAGFVYALNRGDKALAALELAMRCGYANLFTEIPGEFDIKAVFDRDYQ